MAKRRRDGTMSEAEQHIGENQFAHGKTTIESSRLLSLPGELRDYIYELSLKHNEGRIQVNTDTKQPPLLLVCRQIRQEARYTWYTINRFIFTIYECDDGLMYAFHKHLRFVGLSFDAVSMKLELTGFGNWSNLMTWCRHIREGTSDTVVDAKDLGEPLLELARANIEDAGPEERRTRMCELESESVIGMAHSRAVATRKCPEEDLEKEMKVLERRVRLLFPEWYPRILDVGC